MKRSELRELVHLLQSFLVLVGDNKRILVRRAVDDAVRDDLEICLGDRVLVGLDEEIEDQGQDVRIWKNGREAKIRSAL